MRRTNKIGVILLSVLAPTTAGFITLSVATAEASKVTVTFQNSKHGQLDGRKYIRVKPGTKWGDIDQSQIPTPTPDEGYQFLYWSEYGNVITNDTIISNSMTIEPWYALNDAPSINDVKTVNAHFNVWDAATNSYVIPDAIKSITAPITTFNGSNVGYISFSQLFNLYPALKTLFTISTANDVTTITYLANNATCQIDLKNQTINFSDYETFKAYVCLDNLPMTSGALLIKSYLKDQQLSSHTYNSEGGEIIDCKKYNIPLYLYNNEAYIPIHFFKNIFALDINIALVGTGYNSKIYDWNGNGLYEIVEGIGGSALLSTAEFKKQSASGFYCDDYMEYCYNNIALLIDFRYGMIERVRRDNGQIVQYFPNGAYAELKSYHNGLVSIQDDQSSNALRQLFREKLDDGGHSVYQFLNAFSTKAITDAKEIYGDETNNKITLMRNMSQAREKAGITSQGVIKKDYGYKEYKEDGKEPIAYVTFDSFVEPAGLVQGETSRELPPPYTTIDNYMNDTFRLTMYANQQIKDNGIKNVVIDLSNNSGGATAAEYFIASWLCGGVTEKIYNPHTKSYTEFKIEADINGDNTFDENDYLTSDVKLFVITSSITFSCGNLLSTNVQDLRDSTIFIGTRSGGGGCCVDKNMGIGMGTSCQISSPIHMLRNKSRYGNYITNDNGSSVTQGWEINENTSWVDFYKRSEINKKIWQLN